MCAFLSGPVTADWHMYVHTYYACSNNIKKLPRCTLTRQVQYKCTRKYICIHCTSASILYTNPSTFSTSIALNFTGIQRHKG